MALFCAERRPRGVTPDVGVLVLEAATHAVAAPRPTAGRVGVVDGDATDVASRNNPILEGTP